MKTRLLVATLALLGGCASLGPYDDTPPRCETEGDVLFLSGPTDDAMLACVQQARGIDRVVINSTGGNVETALKIGDRLAAMDVVLEVAPGCLSSCTNYFVPVAREVVLRPGALLLSHGGIDAGLVEKAATDDPGATGLADTARLQTDYAERHGIPPGWLLRRRTAADVRQGFGDDVTGNPRGLATAKRVRYVAVEPAFIASCLPDLPVTVLDEDAAAVEARAKAMRLLDALPSGTMQCRPGARWDD